MSDLDTSRQATYVCFGHFNESNVSIPLNVVDHGGGGRQMRWLSRLLGRKPLNEIADETLAALGEIAEFGANMARLGPSPDDIAYGRRLQVMAADTLPDVNFIRDLLMSGRSLTRADEANLRAFHKVAITKARELRIGFAEGRSLARKMLGTQ